MIRVDETIAEEIRAIRLQKPRPTFKAIGVIYGMCGDNARYYAMTQAERYDHNLKKAGGCGRGNKVHSYGKEPPVPPVTEFMPASDIVAGVPPLERSALWQRMSEAERMAYRGAGSL